MAFHDALARRNEAQIAYLREPSITTRVALGTAKTAEAVALEILDAEVRRLATTRATTVIGYPAKPLIPILGGLLTFESEWSPALGPSFEKALIAEVGDGRLDLGCVASHGHFFFDQTAARYTFVNENKPATAFLFKLISQLQFSGTVPMIDVEAYGQWLTK